jgi:alpha-glucosidase (family GH31 glycosyl hydrolase)
MCIAYRWDFRHEPKGRSMGRSISRLRTVFTLLLVIGFAPAYCFASPAVAKPATGGIDITADGSTFTIRLVAPAVLRVRRQSTGQPDAPSTTVLDPSAKLVPNETVEVRDDADGITMSSDRLVVHWDKRKAELSIGNAHQRTLLRQTDFEALAQGRIVLSHGTADALYGIRGYYATEPSGAGLLRSGVQVAKAGEQGYAGAPFVWSTAGYGVLVDAEPARFNLQTDRLTVDGFPSKGVDYFLIVGQPPEVFAALARLSGPAPLFPKWAMGFTNSQWGIDEKELLDIVDTYRAKRIPIDNVTLDFDWKGWGEDNYGEFRWNPANFPDGPNGKLKAELDKRGMHLTGIMKPRIHVDTVQGRYATEHHLWYDAKPAIGDYFSHKPVRDIDFDKPEARAWFFNDTLKHSFDTGIVGWWNDEADDTGDDTQFMNMQRSLYDGQRAHSPLRVWSLNRNFYLGSQRYAYGMWSGDIDTGWASMASQRERMLSAVSLGEWKWGMDGAGFKGHPGNEDYARWVEFGAFTPIFRVHGQHFEKRQPWRYSADAEAAATRAIRLRYTLIPYIYSYERSTFAKGVGLVRPLAFTFPDDPNVRNSIDSWMFGDSLLVSPVVEQGQTSKHIYLPAGRWTDYATGKVYDGGHAIDYPLDSAHWSDIPLFVREGAIIPTEGPVQYVGEHPLTMVEVDVFPAATTTRFDYYDDDGTTYDYEKDRYFQQSMTSQRNGNAIGFSLTDHSGSYRPALRYYMVKIHGGAASAVADAQGKQLPRDKDLAALAAADHRGWASGRDRFGDVTYVKLPAGSAQAISATIGGTP